MTCIGLNIILENRYWIESVLNDPWQWGPFTCVAFKKLAIYIWKYAINLSNYLLCTLSLCVFTKFGFIAPMILLIAHVLLLTAHRSLLIAHKIASLLKLQGQFGSIIGWSGQQFLVGIQKRSNMMGWWLGRAGPMRFGVTSYPNMLMNYKLAIRKSWNCSYTFVYVYLLCNMISNPIVLQ